MVNYRMQAIWEFCRQGYPTLADDAERHWNEGKPYHPGLRTEVSRTLRILIDQCNYEVSQMIDSKNQ